MSNTDTGNVNPLDLGNDPNSVESAAADFDKFLQAEIQPRKERNNRSRPSEPQPKADEAPDTDTDDDGKAHEDADDDRDPILDNVPDDEDDDKDKKDEDADDGQPDDEEDDDADEDELWDREIELEVNGEPAKLKVSELAAGYMKDADYRQKTARLTEERTEVEEYAAEVVQERTHYQSTLQTWIDMTAALMPSQEDWAALEKADPNLFIQTQRQWSAVISKVEEAKALQTEISEREAAQAERNRKAFIEKEDEALRLKVPALANPKKAKAFSDVIMSYAKEVGYTPQELAENAIDHRNVLTLYKAAKYDEIQRSRKAGQRPPKKAPAQVPSNTPRSIGKRPNNNRALRNADRRAAETGSVGDAALAFTQMLRS